MLDIDELWEKDSWEPKGTPPLPPPPKKYGPNKALLRDNGGLHSPLIRPYLLAG